MGNAKPIQGDRIIVDNRRARFDYELGERFEAGIALKGSEVKMLRVGSADLTDAWCAIEHGEAFLRGMNIPIMTGAAFGHDAKAVRKLLLHKKEIETIARSVEREGMTIAATKLYFKNGRVKVELALARGKKHEDKRQTIRERDAERETRAAMSRSRKSYG